MKRTAVPGMFLAVALSLLLPGLHAVPAAGPVGHAGLDGKSLFDEKCGECHRLSMATTRREWKPEWREIVDRMVRKRDGWISPEEAAAIVEYLSADYGKD